MLIYHIIDDVTHLYSVLYLCLLPWQYIEAGNKLVVKKKKLLLLLFYFVCVIGCFVAQ